MQIVRTIVWALLLALLLAFSFFNWRPVEVQIWDNLVLETRLPALVVVSFLIGLVPMWLIHRGTKWRLQRRIANLDAAARSAAAAPPPPPPADASPPPAGEPLAPAEVAAPQPVAGAPVPKDDILR